MELKATRASAIGKLEDVESGVINSKADAIAIADAIHYEKLTLRQIRDKAINLGLNVRNFNQ